MSRSELHIKWKHSHSYKCPGLQFIGLHHAELKLLKTQNAPVTHALSRITVIKSCWGRESKDNIEIIKYL